MKVFKIVFLFFIILIISSIFILYVKSFLFFAFNENNVEELWLKKLEKYNEIVLDDNGIKKFNKEIFKNRSEIVFDMNIYPRNTDITNIVTKIRENEYFLELPEKDYNFSSVKNENTLLYAINIKNANLRIIPTEKAIYSDGDKDFDELQQKKVKFGEPIVILNESLNKKWVLVIANGNSYGWMKKDSLAFTTKQNFINYINNNNFIIVIDRYKIIEDQYLDMNVKLQLIGEDENNYLVKFPEQNSHNNLTYKEIKIKKNDTINKGYLPHTRYNVIKQAFKYLNTPYGWGDMNDGVDCSGFIANIYGVFGFNMPRNSIDQESSAGKIYNFPQNNFFSYKTNKILNELPPASILYFKGHIMLYLGKVGNKYYIIHSIGSQYKNNQKIRIMKVIVSSLGDIKRKNRKTFKNSLQSATIMNF
ncbi:MAG: NlpC/P60 family protein [Rickettsiales bacterium]|nr:NlpC/P60 family protein [Rickettsiales bacterium]